MHTIRDKAAWLKGRDVKCAGFRPCVANPWRLVLLGPPGVGKGTQAELLSAHLGACHLSTGDIFRAAKSLSPQERSPTLTRAFDFMQRGELVPDDVVLNVICERLGCLHCGGGFLLDGFPRTVAQAEALDGMLVSVDVSLNAVVNYRMELSEIVARLAGRLTCFNCGNSFHSHSRPPRLSGVCDLCGGTLVQREDDRPEAVRTRIKAYEDTMQPLLDFYQKRNLLVSVESSGQPEDICRKTEVALKVQSPRPPVIQPFFLRP